MIVEAALTAFPKTNLSWDAEVRAGWIAPLAAANSQNVFPIALSPNAHLATELWERRDVADVLSFATA